MPPPSLSLTVLPATYAVARLSADAGVPVWALPPAADLASVTRTADEVCVVVEAARVPEGVRAEGGWRALRVAGPLDLSLVGVVADLCGALAAAAVPVFVLSTFDTDVILVRGAHLEAAVKALRAGGHRVDAGDDAGP